VRGGGARPGAIDNTELGPRHLPAQDLELMPQY
jgi:hypothetical protein